MSVDARVRYLEESHPDFKYHRKLIVVFFFLRNILLGVQDSIILPSAWQYLKLFKVEEWTYGAVIGAFPAGALLFGPALGLIYDKTLQTKEILDVTNLFLIIGSLLYSLPFSPWLLFFGRLLSGLGYATEPVILAELSLCTYSANRVSSLSMVQLGFVLGLMIGPPLSFAFSYVQVDLGAWRINFTNLPGLSMAALWLLLYIPQCLMIRNVTKVYDIRDVDISEDMYEVDLDNATTSEDENVNAEGPRPIRSHGLIASTLHAGKNVWRQLSCLDSFAIMLSAFCAVSIVNAMAVLLPLVLQEDFNLGVVYTNIVFLFGGLGAAAACLIFGMCGHYVSDVKGIVFINLIGIAGPLFLVSYDNSTNLVAKKILFFCFLAPVGTLTLLTYPCTASVIANTTPPELQGALQSVVNIVFTAGNVYGSIWGSGMYLHMTLLGSITSGCFTLCSILVVLSIPRIRARKIKISKADI